MTTLCKMGVIVWLVMDKLEEFVFLDGWYLSDCILLWILLLGYVQ